MMRKKFMQELIEENKKTILKDKDKINEIYEKIDEMIILKTKKGLT
ncbi:FbpB family small basic protein [Sutcliffiella halmapala]